MYKSIIEKMKAKNIVFANGLTKEEFDKIEKLYDIKFPKELREFLSVGLPIAEYILSTPTVEEPHYEFNFPIWNDFSSENVEKIKNWIKNPKDMLKEEWTDKEFCDFVDNKLENTIPVFAHRYLLQKDNSPILSIWEADDIICYGKDLEDYLQTEFLGKKLESDFEDIDFGEWIKVLER